MNNEEEVGSKRQCCSNKSFEIDESMDEAGKVKKYPMFEKERSFSNSDYSAD